MIRLDEQCKFQAFQIGIQYYKKVFLNLFLLVIITRDSKLGYLKDFGFKWIFDTKYIIQ